MRLIPFLLTLAALAGCVATRATPLGTAVARPPVPADSVVVYRTVEQVPGKYTEIAIVDADGGNLFAGNALLTALRKKAGALGANAIVLLSSREPTEASARVTSAGVPVANVESTSGSYRTKVVAIYVTPGTSP
jgi:hypothetical protein